MSAGHPFDRALARALGSLGEPDRRLAHEIAAGVLRTRRTLDRRLAPLVRAGWHGTAPDLRDVLRIGAYQLLHLSRIPPYAAVQTTVEVAKRTSGARAAGLVNAVLRRVAAEGSLADPPGVETGGLAERYSHPAWLVDRWVARYGAERTEALLRHNNSRPPLVLQPARWTRDQLEAALAQADIPFRAAPFDAGLALDSRPVRSLPGYADGAFIVQDAAQVRLLRFAGIPRGATVWDACASPGGKSVALAAGRWVLASDRSRARLARLRSTVERAAPGVALMVADARQSPVGPGRMDAALVDAPCSATGTMARHPDARWRLTASRLGHLVRLQEAILDGVSGAVVPGGLVVYLTCSVEPEENEAQVSRFLERHPDFARDGDDLLLFPPDQASDGGYGARLRRLR